MTIRRDSHAAGADVELGRLSDEELVALAERAAKRLDPARWVPQSPTPRQAEFLAAPALEALYGGAAGGGKSSALLMAAAAYVDTPGYAALLLRRTYADLALPGAIMDRAKEWWCGKAYIDWSDKDKRFTFPSGATISFGYLDTDRDRFRYQGAELQFLGFDELTQFPEQWYRYLLSRLRRPAESAIPLRARAASNPGGIGHDWVRRRFVDTPSPERIFVPATLADNPHLDAEAYRTALARLDATTRAQLLEGSWVRDSGGLVYAYDEIRNATAVTVPAARAARDAEGWSFLLAIDYGFTDATAFALLGWKPHDRVCYVVRAIKRTGLTPSDAAELARSFEVDYGCVRIVGDISGLGKGYAEEARRRFHLPIEPAEKKNKRGYIEILNGALRAGEVRLMPGCEDLVAEWLELPWDEARKQESAGFDNHCSDAVLYGFRAATAFLAEAAPVEPTEDEIAKREVERMRRSAALQFAPRRGPWRD